MGLLDTVNRLHAGMDYHLARHNLLTANLAHLDTPGFRPLDLAHTEDDGSAFRMVLERTDAQHLAGRAGESQSMIGRVIEDPNVNPGIDGNGVSVDREAVKIATNQLRYDTLAQLTTSELGDLAWAANDGRNG